MRGLVCLQVSQLRQENTRVLVNEAHAWEELRVTDLLMFTLESPKHVPGLEKDE